MTLYCIQKKPNPTMSISFNIACMQFNHFLHILCKNVSTLQNVFKLRPVELACIPTLAGAVVVDCLKPHKVTSDCRCQLHCML